MDPNIDTLRTQAYTAANDTADLQGVAQPMLDNLKQNLVGIFTRDNPVIGARNTALTDYLSSNANTRASLLPSGMPSVEGRPLAISPTQQDAVTTSRNAAALAPLAGYNEILKGIYGNIGDLVGNAGNIYNSTIQGHATRAASLMDLYKSAVQQDQFDQQLALEKQKAKSSSASLLSPELLSLLLGGNVLGASTQAPDLSKYESGAPKQKAAPKQTKVDLSSTTQAAGVPGSNSVLNGPRGDNTGSVLESIINWIKGFAPPPTNYQSAQNLGI